MEIPILLIVFNRPDTTQKVFEVIRTVKPPKLFIAADGPRPHNGKDIHRCAEVRQMVTNVDWECELKLLFQENNLGCGLGPVTAINWFFDHVEQGIILEDDCVPETSFFPYCAQLLSRYQNDARVMMISGLSPLGSIGKKIGSASYFFSGCAHIWGWATWRRAWLQNEFHIKEPDRRTTSLIKDFGLYPQAQIFWLSTFKEISTTREKQAWDYQWQLAIICSKGTCIYPNYNLVKNIGVEGTHAYSADENHNKPTVQIKFPLTHPKKIKRNRFADYLNFRLVYRIWDNNILRRMFYKLIWNVG